jgi:hypothetical protein
MTPKSIKDLSFYNRGIKEGLMTAKIYLEGLPVSDAIEKMQEQINGCEDAEIRLAVELQKTSNPPGDIL